VLGGILQALATGIEAATKVIKDHQKVAQEFEKAVSERYRNYMQGLIDGVAKALDTTSDLLDSVGRKLLIGFRLTFNVLGRELNNMIAQFRKTLEIIDPNLSIDLRNIFRVSYDMDDIKLIIDTNKKAIHEIEQLLLSPDLTDDQRELLEKMLEGYLALIDKAEQTQKRFQELLTGTTAQAISDSIAQGFAQGKRSIEDFADDFESLMRKAMLSIFQLRYLDEEIEKFYNSFADVMDEGLTADKMLELQQLWNKIIEGGIEGLDYLERITGMSLFPEVEETADQLAGAVKGITQESASIIAGQLNALRIGNAQVVTTVVEQLSVLRRIEINTRDISNIYNELKKPNNERVYV
jgi:flagellar biosynthesis/type III secretory pathway protein FliH